MPFALEVNHPTSRSERVELVALRTLVLHPNGYRARYRHLGRGNPQLLVFDDTQPRQQGLAFHLVGNAPPVEVAGVPLHNGHLKPGDVVRWHDYEVTVFELQAPGAAEWAMVDAARSSDAALHVYADWLETQGATPNAEWARLMLSQVKDGMSALASTVSPSFRALVARGPVERCRQSSCAQRWEALALRHDESRVRDCAACKSHVTWCESADVARQIAGPVTIDPAAPRAPRDLLPLPPPVG